MGQQDGPGTPLGGYRQSGLGGGTGVAGPEEFEERKTLAAPAETSA